MKGEPPDPKVEIGESVPQDEGEVNPIPVLPAEDPAQFEARMAELVASFEERIGNLRGHIAELESRIAELRASRDRLSETLIEFLDMRDLGDMIRSARDPLKVVEALDRTLRKVVAYDHLGIFLFVETGKGIEPLGPVPAQLIRAAQNQYDEGIFDWVISERRPVVIPWLESYGEEKDRNLVIVPLTSGERPLGAAILATARRPDEFGAHDLRLISFAVSHAAVGLQNAMRLRELTSTRDFLLNLLENTSDVIFSLDSHGKFKYVNSRIEELGFSKEELQGQSFQALFRQTEAIERIQNVLMRGGKLNADLEVRSRLVRHQQYHLSMTALKNDRGEKIGALGVLRNVTESNRQQRKQLESERLATYTQTVITLNHEINNPLTAVLGNLYLLEKEARSSGNEKVLERLMIIQENCLRIQKVIKKLERIEELKTVSYLGETKMVDIGDV